MTPIHSGTSTERILRALFLSLLVDVFAVLYLYDGYIGYAHKNSAHLAGLLGMQGNPPPIDSSLSAVRARHLADSIRPGEPLEKLSADLGPPAVQQKEAAFFLGPGGWLEVKLSGDRIESARWVNGPHTESDQWIQRWIGWLLVVVGCAATVNLARVLGTKARLSDDGLQVTGQPLIPFEAMTALRRSGSSRDVVELEFVQPKRAAARQDSKLEGGGATGSTIRLDPYMYKNTPAIVQAIAQRRGLANP